MTNSIFFDDCDWISLPEDWRGPIVQGKSYSDTESIGARLWDEVQQRLEKVNFFAVEKEMPNQLSLEGNLDDSPRYKESVLSRVRLGQGAFRIYGY